METKIKSVSEFIDAVVKIASKREENNSQELWFRGEGSVNWATPLIPNSYREIADIFKNTQVNDFTSTNIKELEVNIHAQFYRRTHSHISSKGFENSKWNRYFLMQHYKINTRLLDWTENALVALHFAISDTMTPNDDSVVWVLDPFELNNLTIKTLVNTEKSCPFIPSGSELDNNNYELRSNAGSIRLNEITRRYLQMDFNLDETAKTYYPLAIHPPYLDERMSAQKTCFTIFGNRINGLLSNTNNPRFLDRVVIEGGHTKTKMLMELQMLGIDHESIYPGLDGIGLSIKFKNEKYSDNSDATFHLINSTFEKQE